MLATYLSQQYIFPFSAILSMASNMSSYKSYPRPATVRPVDTIFATILGVVDLNCSIISPLELFPIGVPFNLSTNPSFFPTGT